MKLLKITIVNLLMITVLTSCQQKKNGNQNTEPQEMKYTVKKTEKPIELTTDWNDSQWENANVLTIENYIRERPEHFPKAQAKLMYDDNYVYAIFRVEDNYIRVVADTTHGKVWQDSCVEFFFSPDANSPERYFNLETNAGGTMLFRYNDKTAEIENYLDPADCNELKIQTTLPTIVEPEITEPTTWTLTYKIPIEVLEKYATIVKPASGVQWRANFYKCADKTSHPHWLCWSPITQKEKAHFHLPQYFGAIEFE